MNVNHTGLHEWHVKHGAHMAPFAGYDMPLWYSSGAREEHLCVLTACGLFDTGHMSVLKITGPDSYGLLQKCFSRDLNCCTGNEKKPLSAGECTYGVFLSESDGGVIDDSIVCKVAPDVWLVVVNAGMGAVICRHLESYKNSFDVIITDLTELVGKIDIQGPLSGMVLRHILSEPDSVFEGLRYFRFKGSFDNDSSHSDGVRLLDGTPVMLSRTGYTGEFGFELFCGYRNTVKIWEALLAVGERYSIKTCGLGARDSLRTGAVLPLSHQDIGNWPFLNNPWTFALPYNTEKTGFTKEFIGRKALENASYNMFTCPFTGYDVRKVADGIVIDNAGDVIGTVLTCVTDTGIGRVGDTVYSITSPDKPEGFVPKGLSCGFLKISRMLPAGEMLMLKDGRREIQVSVVEDIRPARSARYPIEQMIT
ncbi:MAG: aminomethyltransferase family protein [Candidatus Latescibacteria bacterium]|nr:aminomethyltransferase family protein [Candidatus Latescibacterota bacterium]